VDNAVPRYGAEYAAMHQPHPAALLAVYCYEGGTRYGNDQPWGCRAERRIMPLTGRKNVWPEIAGSEARGKKWT
jgi:hypothetical protein